MHASAEACVVIGANLGQPVGIVMLNAEGSRRGDVEARGDGGHAGRAPAAW